MITTRKNKKIILMMTIFVFAMFGFCYALVPFYNVLCKVTGLNGKVDNNSGQNYSKMILIDKSREVTVEFVATNNASLPWKFYPHQTKIRLHPGEVKHIAFYAQNNSGRIMTIQAIPSVTPGEAAKYLKKTECFCFKRQTLKSGEAADLPVIFHVDPDLPKDIKRLTLSYTLFDVSQISANSNQETGKIL